MKRVIVNKREGIGAYPWIVWQTSTGSRDRFPVASCTSHQGALYLAIAILAQAHANEHRSHQ